MPIDLSAIVEATLAEEAAISFLRRITAGAVTTHESSFAYHVLVLFQGFPIAVVWDDGSDEQPEWVAPEPPPPDPETGEKGLQVTGIELRAFRSDLEIHARRYLGLDFGGADVLVAALAGVGVERNGLQAALRFRQIVTGFDRDNGLHTASVG